MSCICAHEAIVWMQCSCPPWRSQATVRKPAALLRQGRPSISAAIERSMKAFSSEVTDIQYTGQPKMMPSASKTSSATSRKASAVGL